MASGGDDTGKSTPLKDFLNLGRKAFTRSPDTFQDARDDLMIPKLPDIKVLTKPFGAGIKIPAGTIDPKASRQGLTTQPRKGSRSDLRPDETDDNLSTASGFAYGSFKDTGARPKGNPASTRPVVEVEPEEPFLHEELSDEEVETLVDLDAELLDPEQRKDIEPYTLAAIFKNVKLKPEDLARDPEPVMNRIIEISGLSNSIDVEEYLKYYKDLCYYRRKIYLHARLILRKLIDKDFQASEAEDLLYYTENSKTALDFVHTKIVDMYDITSGQKRSYTCAIRNFVQAIDTLKDIVNVAKQTELKLQQETIQKAEADRVKAENEKEKALSQINALQAAREAKRLTESNADLPSIADVSRPTRSGNERTGDRPETGASFRSPRWSGVGQRGRGGRGGRTPDRGNNPPFRPSQNDERDDPISVLIQGFTDALNRRDSNTKPDYRGIEKPKVDPFSGDALVYAHWKKRFLLLYGDRNLDDAYLANTLHGLLKGEAKALVEAHFTADWDGVNYHRMWTQLDEEYGSKHTQDRCIQDRAAKIAFLEHETLKTVGKFHLEVTVQINYYLDRQPVAVTTDNSHLYQQIRQKISDKLFLKFAEWTDSPAGEDFPSRSLLTLNAWLAKRMEYLRETETFSTSAKYRASKSPPRSSHLSLLEEEQNEESDSDTEPNNSIMLSHPSGKRVLFDAKKNKYYKYKPFPSEDSSQETHYSFKGNPVKFANRNYNRNSETTDQLCPVCRDISHELSTCPKFRKLTVFKRYSVVRYSKACYHCLNRGHSMLDCKVDKGKLCGVDGCKRYESPLIHADESTRRIPYQDWNTVTHGELIWTEDDGRDIPSGETFTSVMQLAKEGAVGQQTIVCNISGAGRRQGIKTVVMLDSGADRTYVDEQTAFSLGLKPVTRPITTTIGQFDGSVKINTQLVEVTLTSVDGMLTQTINAWTKKNLTDKTRVVDWSKCKRNFEHIKDVPFEKLPKDARIRLLIGTENAFIFGMEEGTQHRGSRGEPTAYMCALGWTCYGPSEYIDPDLQAKLYPLMDKQIPRNR